jgi:hypothetical protein
VILEADAGKSIPKHDKGVVDAFIRIRPGDNPFDNQGYILLRGRAGGDDDLIAWSNQGVFPVSNNSFEYTITDVGFENWYIRVVGYFP